ncbi:DNA primase [Streptomyces sp. NPDC054940]
MNRVGLGLAIGAGYVLGRTRKLKLALAVGSVVAGKRMHLSPRGVADLVSEQLLKNPQFKEIGDQLREDLRGVGEAASGALVERQLDALSDRLHGRTAEVREQLSGAVPTPDLGAEDEDAEEAEEETGDEEPRAEDDDLDEAEESEGREEAEEPEEPEDEEPSGKAAPRKTARKAPAKQTAAKKTTAGRTAPKKAAAKRSGTGKSTTRQTAGARGSARGGRARQSKGGEGR